MRRLSFLLILFIFSLIHTGLIAQDILLKIGDKEISLEEFERIYNKNNSAITENKQTPEEYLDLFINFKLKVLEAERLGMDTTEKFLAEFNKYKDLLAQPYLTDEETKEYLMKEAYERMLKDVHVSHILLSMPGHVTPEDSLKRYKQALEIRQRIIDGEDFATVAKATSDDPSVRLNGGDLGFFTVFMMVYPFETAAYNLDEGEISMPLRTIHGYHILKKHESRPAVGKVKVAHIFKPLPPDMPEVQKENVKKEILSIRDSIDQGVDFELLALRHSGDPNSAKKGGELPWFGTGRMIDTFEKVAFNLEKPGEVSDAFQSDYGWHIVKLIDKKGIGTYEEMRSELQSKALKGDRDKVKREMQLIKLKEKYNFQLNQDLYQRLYYLVDSTIFEGNWDAYKNTGRFDENIFTLNDNNGATLGAFVHYLDSTQRKREEMPVKNYVDILFNQFVEKKITDIEKESLTERFPDYKYILREYHDGLLLFDLMSEKVWSHAQKDSAGIERFFNNHRDDYMFDERIEVIVVNCDSTTDIASMKKKAHKILRGSWKLRKLNRKFCENRKDKCITLETKYLSKDEHELVDLPETKGGVSETYPENGKLKFMIRKGTVPPMYKELHETRGKVTSDYQDYLEKKWNEELREKYEIEVNEELLSKVKLNN